jgi:hypothetical protein
MNLSMLNEARQLKAKLDKAQKELGKMVIEVDAGKGAVKVAISGQQKVRSITISPDVIDPDKAAKLEELVVKAVNEAIAQSQKLAAKQMGGLTQGLKIPGLF